MQDIAFMKYFITGKRCKASFLCLLPDSVLRLILLWYNFVNDENFVANLLYLLLTLQLERKEREMKILVRDLMFLVWNGGRATTPLPPPPTPPPNLFLKNDFLCTLLDRRFFSFFFLWLVCLSTPLFKFLHPGTPHLYRLLSSSTFINGNVISSLQFYSSYSILTLLFYIPVSLGWRRILLEKRGKTETNLFCLVKACENDI